MAAGHVSLVTASALRPVQNFHVLTQSPKRLARRFRTYPRAH